MSVARRIHPLRPTFITSPDHERVRVRVYFLPYAGGSAHAFVRLVDALPTHIDARPLDYPGHGRRLGEPLARSIAETAAYLADTSLDFENPAIPYVLYGHSMGALVAYELCRLITERRGTLPALLIAAAHRAPHLPSRTAPVHAFPEAGFLDEIYRLDPGARHALESPELRAIMLPILRNDFRACETYDTGQPRMLCVPLAIYSGLSDEEITRDESLAWQEHFDATCTQRFLPGGHFFLKTHVRELVWALSWDIAETLAVTARPARRGWSGQDHDHLITEHLTDREIA